MRHSLKSWSRFTIIYGIWTTILYILAPDRCSGFICFYEKDFVLLVAWVNYFFIALISCADYVWNKKWRNPPITSLTPLHLRLSDSLRQLHFTLSALFAPIGAFIFILNFGGLSDDLETTLGIVCWGNWGCEDTVGDVSVWFISTTLTFFLIYYLPYTIRRISIRYSQKDET
jgi:hypothetical protein